MTVRTVFSIERLSHEVIKRTCSGYFPHGDERAKPVHRYWPLIFNSITALDMLSFAFLKQSGPGGHTNSHDNPHFSLIAGPVEVRSRGGTLKCAGETLRFSPYRRWVVNLLDVPADRDKRWFDAEKAPGRGPGVIGQRSIHEASCEPRVCCAAPGRQSPSGSGRKNFGEEFRSQLILSTTHFYESS